MLKHILVEVGVTVTLIFIAALQIDRIEKWGK
jgi:hypothetical protein